MFVITNNERNYIVYCHVFPTGKTLKECKKYFGITGRDYNERWGNNGIGYYGQHVFSAILYYGWSNITHYIMYRNLTKEEAEQKEKELIARYKTTDPRYGYNIAEGGIDTAKYHKKVICINTGEVFLTAKEAGIKYNARVDHACRGVAKTAGIHPETKEKLIWQFYDEWLLNPKQCNNIKHDKHGKRKVLCIETNKIYNSCSEASNSINISCSGITKACRGKNKTAGGYHWKYIDD